MRSPFPGMDPDMEQSWSDVQSTLIPLIRKSLQAQPAALLASRSHLRRRA